MDAAALLEAFLTQSEIPFRRAGETQWGAQLRGERKLTIPILFTLTSDRISFESFFMRAPRENLDRFYDLLLRRNMRAYGVHFALDAAGDVYLVGSRPLQGLDGSELDRILGAILVEADGLFDAAIKIGFESYLEADLAWRAKNAGNT